MHANAMKFLLMLDEKFFGSEEKMNYVERRFKKKEDTSEILVQLFNFVRVLWLSVIFIFVICYWIIARILYIYSWNEFLWQNLDDFSWHGTKGIARKECQDMDQPVFYSCKAFEFCFCSYFNVFFLSFIFGCFLFFFIFTFSVFKRRDATLQKAQLSFHRIAKCLQCSVATTF